MNLFLGWTFIGWIGALIWSVSAIKIHAPAKHKEILVARPDREDPYSRIEKLAELRDRGHLTAEEFEAEKSKVLGR
ncbi:SHOCT domain-containing protein [Pseudomonas juntendi]|nr:SHOCT domain-containing protein [Pseudomonas juntendi]